MNTKEKYFGKEMVKIVILYAGQWRNLRAFVNKDIPEKIPTDFTPNQIIKSYDL